MNRQTAAHPDFFINMAAFLPCSSANGPGRRAVVWVQGCPRDCPSCFNQEMRAFAPNQAVTATELASRILAVRAIEGVTFSGGEPFAQAAALAGLAGLLAANGLTVVTFTGYSYEELVNEARPGWSRLLGMTDLLVAGPYVREKPTRQYLLASANQQRIFLTDRLTHHPDVTGKTGHIREFIIDAAGNITITGLA